MKLFPIHHCITLPDSPHRRRRIVYWQKKRINPNLISKDQDPNLNYTPEPTNKMGRWQLLESLRDSIVNKPPYVKGTLQLPDSYFSLFYKVDKDGLAARFVGDP